MNPKIVLSFVAGAALASGIVYYAARTEPPVHPIVVSSGEQPAARPAADPSETVDSATLPPLEQSSRVQPNPTREERATERVPGRTVERSEARSSGNRASGTKPSPGGKNREEGREIAQADPPTAPSVQKAPPVQNTTAPVRQDPAPAPTQATEPPQVVQPAPAPPTAEDRGETAPAPQQPHSVTLAPGTTLQVRVGETLSTKKSQPGDTFLATLTQPLVVDGFVIAERGARAEGRVVEADKAGKVKGVPLLVVELTRFSSSDGQSVKVHTSAYNQEGKSPTARNAAKVGLGAALGAVIGAAAGGGKGAGIGAGVGGAAGAGDVLLTKGPDAEIPVETRLSFKIQEPVTITERLH